MVWVDEVTYLEKELIREYLRFVNIMWHRQQNFLGKRFDLVTQNILEIVNFVLWTWASFIFI